MPLDLEQARRVLREAAKEAEGRATDAKWIAYVEEISRMCEEAGTRTHVAFLGTAILAKATDPSTDAYSVKLTDKRGSYSARTLAHEVLVKMAPELGIHLGVTGREPLNNMPYFRMERLGDGTRIHTRAASTFKRLVAIIGELSRLSQADARRALRSFICVRRKYQPRYAALPGAYYVSVGELSAMVESFVTERSDGGKRAQAVVAGLLDVVVGVERVSAGRINDPSRHYPGDVALRSEDDSSWEKVFEVRDKPVSLSDLQIFGMKCLAAGIRQTATVAIAGSQSAIDRSTLEAWAKKHGVGLRLFLNWNALIDEMAFWSPYPSLDAVSRMPLTIHARLVDIEAPETSVEQWIALVKPYRASSPS